jgi:O-antigen ligase
MVLWPSSVGIQGDLGKQLSVLLLIATAFVVAYRLRLTFRFNLLAFLILLFALYQIINVLLNPIFNLAGSFRDLAEVVRILGCLLFFLIGQNFYRNSDNISEAQLAVVSILLLSLLGSFYLGFLQFPFSIYHTRGARFSGIATSVNYVFSSILFIGLLLITKGYTGRRLLLYFIPFIFSFIIIFSGSRTSLGVVLLALVVGLVPGQPPKRVAFSVLGGLFVGYLTLMILEDSGYLKRLLIYFQLIANLDFDISSYSTLAKRLTHWSESSDTILERVYFGHGGSKAVLRILDNSYLMTTLRYGLVGLILELTIYATSLFLIFRKFGNLKWFYVAFIIAHLISGITTSFAYELRVPYILYFVLGVVSMGVIGERNRTAG